MGVTDKPSETLLREADSPASLKGKPADVLFPRDSKAPSPYRPDHLIRIFLDARSFFSPDASLGSQKALTIACWIIGTSIAITRLEQELIKAELGKKDLISSVFWELGYAKLIGQFLWP